MKRPARNATLTLCRHSARVYAAIGSVTTDIIIHFRPTPAGTQTVFHHPLPTPDMVQSRNDG